MEMVARVAEWALSVAEKAGVFPAEKRAGVFWVAEKAGVFPAEERAGVFLAAEGTFSMAERVFQVVAGGGQVLENLFCSGKVSLVVEV